MLLTIDAGNTRVKWGVFNAEGIMLEYGACLNADLTTVQLPKAACAVVSNVAGDKVKALLEKLLVNYFQVNWVKAQTTACGVTNAYVEAETLGTDRWAALIAAWHISQKPSVVVNAGTAITIDVLNATGIFLGGTIMPGLRLMRESLNRNAARLSVGVGEVKAFPINTQDAIETGCMNAALASIMMMAERMQSHHGSPPAIIITGGDAQIIKDNLIASITNHTLIVDNLVLQGLYLLEKLRTQDA
ncbi:MAG: type III pantothenate kinase [Betaproteobacteria bacterium HGW-Betaproteobacteria-20]|jgi:type III pantothenate kinase|nr:MAG: type III pantothenate kinase [Betaproteobacteria bacterium HGW-Betaproteobacteria-20]